MREPGVLLDPGDSGSIARPAMFPMLATPPPICPPKPPAANKPVQKQRTQDKDQLC
jgi:hypothetical protein